MKEFRPVYYGGYLKFRRESLGLTIEQMSEGVGIASETLRTIEANQTGKAQPINESNQLKIKNFFKDQDYEQLKADYPDFGTAIVPTPRGVARLENTNSITPSRLPKSLSEWFKFADGELCVGDIKLPDDGKR